MKLKAHCVAYPAPSFLPGAVGRKTSENPSMLPAASSLIPRPPRPTRETLTWSQDSWYFAGLCNLCPDESSVWGDNQSLRGGGLGIRDGEKTQSWSYLRISLWELERPLPGFYWKNQNQALREAKHLVVWFLVNFFTKRSKSGYVIKWNLGYMLFIRYFLSQTQ